MKKTLTLILSVLLLMTFSVCKGQGKNETLHRTAGYKGSVSFTNQLVFIGLDTSHGYMFNSHHYLGGGAGFFIMPFDSAPAFGRVFADYKAYIMKRNSTPTAGLQAGYSMALKDLSGNTFQKAFEVSPHIGWNWAFNEKVGLDLSIGASLFVHGSAGNTTVTRPMPKISIGIEF